jgi:FkbM family methyltransferase
MTGLLDGEMIRFTASPASPFVLRHLPLLGRLYLLSRMYGAQPRGLKQTLISALALRAYRALRSAGYGGTGIVQLRRPDGQRDLKFDVRNTQFHALYMAELLPTYEPETTALIGRLVGTMDTFFDIGANWGWHCVVIASQPGFTGTVHAFEPYPPSFADLVSIVSQAGLTELVHCHDLALGNSDGEATMLMPDGIHSGVATLEERRWRGLAAGGGMPVKLARLDSLNLPPPSVIKLDVEDHEYEVLEGARQVIATARPFLIFESLSDPRRPHATATPLRLLEEWNYRLYFHAWLAEDGTPWNRVFDVATGKWDGVSWSGGAAQFALVPFSRFYRGLLAKLTNIVALPLERVAEVKATLERETQMPMCDR